MKDASPHVRSAKTVLIGGLLDPVPAFGQTRRIEGSVAEVPALFGRKHSDGSHRAVHGISTRPHGRHGSLNEMRAGLGKRVLNDRTGTVFKIDIIEIPDHDSVKNAPSELLVHPAIVRS